MGIVLIGLGLFDEKDISLRGIEETRHSDNVYIELYTSKWHGNLRKLEKIIGKQIIELKRKDLEENSHKIIEESKTKKISILVEGDPLIATTHSSLLLEARRLGIKTKVIHNASIISAIGETGLHIYKFGPIVTIPFPEKTKNKPPESIFEIIKENKKRGLHTLCLLDVISEENKYMSINEGMQVLLSGKVISEKDKLVVFAKVGSGKPIICYDTADNLKSLVTVPVVIIVPGKLHFSEEEYLGKLTHE